jgi:hypothetical protein
MADLEDALKKLDRLTQEEARMAHAEVLRITHSIRDGVQIVDGKVEEVGDKVQCVDDKVQVVIDGARGLYSQLKGLLTSIFFRQHASKSSGTGNKVGYSTGGQRHRRNQVFVAS